MEIAMYATFWALIPPVIAIILALITKEVYSSLFIGIVVSALFYSGFSFEGAMNHVLQDGLIASLADSYNVGILIFLVLLGSIVALMNKGGASAAFGKWASKNIKTKIGAQLATVALGVIIFIDDYFNCLTVGSVMRPITDKHKISRAKLAYLIDATAAPICIISPISSWAAAVSGFVEDENGFNLFMRAIPFNFYALLTICMMIVITVMKVDYGPMALHEANAEKGDLFTSGSRAFETTKAEENSKGEMVDLLVPIIVLIMFCIIGMIYTGGFFTGTAFIEAFANCDASVGLALGSLGAVIVTIIYYLCRRILPFRSCMDSLVDGFKAMTPAILILTLAWTLKNMTDSLGAKEYVASVVSGSAQGFASLLPAIVFLIACFLAFATGTSWGTFGILIPIVVNIFAQTDFTMMVISMSACMAGAVCGDHCSPISDTTIMSSAGAQCDHVNHVSTQMPYAVTVAAISFISYIVAGFTRSAIVSLLVGLLLLIGTMLVIKKTGFGKQVVE